MHVGTIQPFHLHVVLSFTSLDTQNPKSDMNIGHITVGRYSQAHVSCRAIIDDVRSGSSSSLVVYLFFIVSLPVVAIKTLETINRRPKLKKRNRAR